MKTTGWLPSLILFKPKYYYENKKIQKRYIKGPAIVISNHKTTLDPFLLMFVFVTRYLRCLVGEIIYVRVRSAKTILNLFGSIKVERYNANPDFIGECNEVLQHGDVIQIFPEGRLPLRGSEMMLPFKSSAALIAIQSRVPIIPVYHTGNYGIFKRETIAIGVPIHIYESTKVSNPSLAELQRLTKILEQKILELKAMVEHGKK
jgi:1-acyl-sn-glycerol-3-phosphate acyltransferase